MHLGLLALLCGAYSLSQFFRAANGVIGPDLLRELSLSPADLSLMTSMYFIVFGLVQPFVGMLLDRYGPRLTMTGLMLAAIAGSEWFALSANLSELVLARALLGLGTSALLMGGLVVISRWFAPQRFTLLSSIIISVGSLGSLLSTAPLASITAHFGWRVAFHGMAGVTAITALLVIAFVRDAPTGHASHTRAPETLRHMIGGFVAVLRNKQSLLLLVMNFAIYPVAITVQGLWGGPYLRDIHGLDLAGRGDILLIMAACGVAGYLVFGPLDRMFDTRKWLAVGAVGMMVLACLILALIPQPPLWLVGTAFSMIGFFGGSYIFVLAHGRAIFPDHLAGRGLTLLNFGTMFGSFAVQYGTGLLIAQYAGGAGTSENAYRALFAVLALVLVAAAAIYSRSVDAPPSRDALPPS